MTATHRHPGRRLAVVTAGALLTLGLLATPALAHVTVRTDNPSAEGFAKYTVRVPNERDEVETVSVEVQMPEGLEASLYQPVPGWDISLADGVLTIEGGTIEPGQFQEFSFSARNPAEPGEISFAALQTYADGEVVEWIGERDSDTPASVVEIVAAEGEEAEGATATPTEVQTAAVSTEGPTAGAGGEGPTSTSVGVDGGGSGLVYAAVVLGALGLLAGGGALFKARQSQ